MATKRFCDICDTLLTFEDDKPFIRELEYGDSVPVLKAKAHVMVMNEQDHVITDVCNKCKLKIVNEGEPVATLQPSAPARLFESSTILQSALPPPPTPIRKFEPSIKPETDFTPPV